MDTGFWSWYFKGFKVVFALKWVSGAGPWLEYISGILIAAGISVGLSISFSPLWLLLTIPVGFTIAMHGIWRWEKAWNRRFSRTR